MAPAQEAYAPGNTPPSCVEDWAFLGHLTVSQHQALQDFRQLLQDNASTRDNIGKKSDATLLRFLRARQFDLKKTMKMVMDDLEWRLEIANKRISRDQQQHILPFIASRLIRASGLDRQGRLVLILSLNQVFPKKVSDIMEIVSFFIFYMESVVKYVTELGFTEFTAIGDMKGWSLSENFSLPVVQVLAGLLQDHYPEMLRYAFVVNNPFAFSAAWGLISNFLEERVKAKVHVFGKKLEKLKDYIAPENLDAEFGGTRTELYAAPDMFVQPMVEGKVAVVASVPHDPITWEDELTADAKALVKEAAKSEDVPKEEGLERDFEQIALHASGKPAQLQKKKSMRKTIARMFSTKSLEQQKPASVPAPVSPRANEEQRPMELIPAKPRPRVAVFGGTGRTGRECILSLLDQHKCDVSAFVRIHGSNLSPDLVQRATTTNPSGPNLSVFVGEFGSLLDLERVVEDCDAVIITIGVLPALTGGSGAEFLPLAIDKILEAMSKFQVRRLVMVSSAHASQSWWESGAGLLANVTKPVYWKNHYQYVAQMENSVIGCGGRLDYTIVRPGTLVEDAEAGGSSAVKIEEGFVFADSGPGEIARPALCKFLLSEALDFKAESKYCNKGVAIGRA